VPADEALNETIVFEVPFRTRAESLRERLRLRWHVGLYDGDDVVLVAAELQAREGDLAVLLREVELWLGDSNVGILRFHLDARTYVLEAGFGLRKPAAA
jgi:hypothetical protein